VSEEEREGMGCTRRCSDSEGVEKVELHGRATEGSTPCLYATTDRHTTLAFYKSVIVIKREHVKVTKEMNTN